MLALDSKIGTKFGKLTAVERAYKRKGRETDISFEEYKGLILADCTYCGASPEEGKTNGIDRVDSSVDYLFENCTPCCAICNRMKSNLNVMAFLEHVRRIVANYKEGR